MLGFNAGEIDGRVSCEDLVGPLTMCAMIADWPAAKPMPRGREKLLYFAEKLAQWNPDLEATGVKGVMKDARSTPRALTWSEFRQDILLRAEHP